MYNIGDRVGALVGSDEETKILTVAGFGVYEGDVVPETDDIKFMGIPLKEVNRPNPKIALDNGSTVWGCECWWGAETKVKEQIEEYKNSGYTVEEIKNFDDWRKDFYAKGENENAQDN